MLPKSMPARPHYSTKITMHSGILNHHAQHRIQSVSGDEYIQFCRWDKLAIDISSALG